MRFPNEKMNEASKHPHQRHHGPQLHALGAAALEQWRRHYLNDHLPARRDCAQCVRAQARSKPHRRIEHPESFTLSVDLSGKLSPGDDQHGKDCKYLLVGCYTYPVTKDGKSLVPIPGQSDQEEDHPLPGLDEDLDADVDEHPHEDDEAVLPEEEELVDEGDSPEVRAARSMQDTWLRLVKESKNVMVKHLTFVEPVKSRNVKHVLPAISRLHARIRSLGLPVYRLHSDRAREFCAAPIKAWALERSILTTMTSGSTYKANGRVEGEMNVVKKAIRTLITAGAATLKQWPLAARHIGERRLRVQLNQLGWPVGRLLRFGATAFALRKSWQERYAPWRDIREEVTVLGPDIYSSLTNTGYYVKSKTTGRHFFTDDIVVPELPQPAVEDQVLYLPERSPDAPMYRHRKKASVPAISMFFDIEGERVITQRHPEMFEFPLVTGASSDSWSLETEEASTPSTTRSAIGPEVDELGGGDTGEVPNTWAGGSHPGTSTSGELRPTLRGLFCKGPALRSLHNNVTEYIREELHHIDASTAHQVLWMPTVNEAMMNRLALEEKLLSMMASQEDQTGAENEFLVTRTVPNKEVWNDLDNWQASIEAEFKQLVIQKEAVKQISRSELYEIAERKQLPIELLPGKMVHTRKAGSGAYRSRAVVCGNYQEASNEEKYAGGADGCQIRTMIRTAALKRWSMAGTDIRVAFLNAPKRNDKKITAMEVPYVFKRLGLAAADDVWLIEKALYGLVASPRDWCLYRDEIFPTLRWHRHAEGDDFVGRFVHSGDDNMWRLLEVNTRTGEEVWAGLMSVYVDDLLVSADQATIKAALETVANTWSISAVEWASVEKPVRYCGFEIAAHADGDGFQLSQRSYEQELLSRWKVSDKLAFPAFKVTEEDEAGDEHLRAEDIKTAQALTGALLWLSTRTRPDLVHGVSVMSRLVSKHPKKSVEIGMTLLKYINGNPGGIHVPTDVANGRWGARGQLKVQRHEKSLEVYADIAYAAGSQHRSLQGLVVMFAGVPVAWQCSQQPFVTHSTAEAELVSYCEALLAGRSSEALLCAMWGENIGANTFERTLYGDNAAAIGLAHGVTSSSWRTRHLRIRSSILKEALEEDPKVYGGKWKLLHLKGTELVADGCTKPLLGQAFFRFLEDLGLKRGADEKGCDVSPRDAEGPPPTTGPSSTIGNETNAAVMAMAVGSLLLSGTDAAPDEDGDPESYTSWVCGALLMALGTIYLTRLTVNGVQCCVKRLRAPWSLKDEEDHWILCKEDSDDERVVVNSATCAGASSSSLSQPMTSQSGSQVRKRAAALSSNSAAAVAESSAAGPMTRASSTTSGSATAATSSSMTSGLAVAAASSSMTSGLASAATSSAMASGSAVAAVEGRTGDGASQMASTPKMSAPKNPWNQFQHQNRGKGFSRRAMSLLYRYEKEKNKENP